MGYIRSNEDYYMSLGMSEKEARIQVKLDQKGVDPGFCNPMKAQDYHDAEEEARREVEKEMKGGDV